MPVAGDVSVASYIVLSLAVLVLCVLHVVESAIHRKLLTLARAEADGWREKWASELLRSGEHKKRCHNLREELRRARGGRGRVQNSRVYPDAAFVPAFVTAPAARTGLLRRRPRRRRGARGLVPGRGKNHPRFRPRRRSACLQRQMARWRGEDGTRRRAVLRA